MGNVSSMTKPNPDELRLRCKQLIEGGMSQEELAKQAGMSGSTFGRWLAEKYAGDNDKIDRQVSAALDVLADRQAAALALPEKPGWVATPTAERIWDVMRYAHIAGDIVLIYGAAGVSKSETAKEYRRRSTNVWMITSTGATSRIPAMLHDVAVALGLPPMNGPGGRPDGCVLYRAIVEYLTDTKGLLFVDESHNLGRPALDQLRQIHDATGIGLVLMGNEAVYTQLAGPDRADYLDRLYSRVGQRLRLTGVTQKDADAILAAWKISAKDSIKIGRQIAINRGGLRSLTNTLRLASMYAAGEQAAVNCNHIRAAWKRLGSAS